MSQSDFGTINASTKTGTQLATDLNDWRDALHSTHSGASRPNYIQPGMVWIKQASGSLWQILLYDGTGDVEICRLDPAAGTAQIAADTVASTSLAPGAVTSGKIAASAVTTAAILTAAVTAAKLATDAVETAKIKDLNVTNAKIADATIEFGKLATSALATQAEAEAGVSAIKLMTASRVAEAIAALGGGAFEKQLLHVRDEKPVGTDGGTFTSGAWRTRDLNTVKTNQIPGASLSGNQITLPAGTYHIQASAPGHEVNRHKARLQNISDGNTTIIGTNSESNSAYPSTTHSLVAGRFAIASAKSFELQHYCSTTRTVSGFGPASSFNIIEAYSDIMIWNVV